MPQNQSFSVSMSRKPKEYWDDDGTNLKPNINRTVRDFAGNLLGGFDDSNSIDSPTVKNENTYGTTILTNGTLDAWADGIPTSWPDLAVGTGTFAEEATIVHTEGGKSIKLIYGSGEHGTSGVYQLKTGLTVGATYALDVWGYGPDTNSSDIAPAILALNGTFGVDATDYWSWDTNEWVAMVGGDPSPGITDWNNSGDTWEHLETAVGVGNNIITVPASGKIGIALITKGDAMVEGDIAYIDDVTLQPFTAANAVSLFDFSNASDATKLLSTDSIFKFQTTGGTDKTHFEMNGAGQFKTDYTTFDFTSGDKPLLVKATLTEPGAAVNQTDAKVLLGVSGSVNLKNTGASTLNFTLPANYKLINPEIVAELTAADTLTGNATFTVGTNSADYNNIFGSLTQNMTTPNYQKVFSTSGNAPVCSTAGEAFVKITSGTSGTAKFYLYGTLVATA